MENPKRCGECTKYSFPSKNLEYMSTGTPLLTTKLAGIPSDHYPYIYTIEQDSIEAIKESLENILSFTKDEIHEFGSSAKKYVMHEKSNVKQAARIINLLRNNC